MTCIRAVTVYPYGPVCLAVICAVILILIFGVVRPGFGEGYRKDRARNIQFSEHGSYGTAKFMDKTELKDVLEISDIRHHTGIILGESDDGKAILLPVDTNLNRNIAVYGSSGSGKSRAINRNYILQAARRKESMIITDVKSELYQDTSRYLSELGYTVRVLNLIQPECSDGWDCLASVDSDITAQIFCDIMIANTSSQNPGDFWSAVEKNYLKALVLYVATTSEHGTIGDVCDLIAMSPETLDNMFGVLPAGHPARIPYAYHKQASETVRSGAVIGLGTRMGIFQNNGIRDLTSHDEIDLTLPGKQPCAYYLVSSDQDSTFDAITMLFLSFLFRDLVRFADEQPDGKLPVYTTIVAEELANIGRGQIKDLEKKISTIRSRNLAIVLTIQNIGQLQNRYPHGMWAEILGGCDTQILCGTSDDVTARYASDRAGETTIGVSSRSKQLSAWRMTDYVPQYRETDSVGHRKLYTPDEIQRLPVDQELIMIRGHNVLQAKKLDFSKHPDADRLTLCKASDHIPAWRNESQSAPLTHVSPSTKNQNDQTRKIKPINRINL